MAPSPRIWKRGSRSCCLYLLKLEVEHVRVKPCPNLWRLWSTVSGNRDQQYPYYMGIPWNSRILTSMENLGGQAKPQLGYGISAQHRTTSSWGKLKIHLCWLIKFPLLPSGKHTKLAIENGPVEIVDFPMKKWCFSSSQTVNV